jgi:penicillin-binding protein 2
MTELRNVEADLSRFRARVLAASLVVLTCFLLLACGWCTCRCSAMRT